IPADREMWSVIQDELRRRTDKHPAHDQRPPSGLPEPSLLVSTHPDEYRVDATRAGLTDLLQQLRFIAGVYDNLALGHHSPMELGGPASQPSRPIRLTVRWADWAPMPASTIPVETWVDQLFGRFDATDSASATSPSSPHAAESPYQTGSLGPAIPAASTDDRR